MVDMNPVLALFVYFCLVSSLLVLSLWDPLPSDKLVQVLKSYAIRRVSKHGERKTSPVLSMLGPTGSRNTSIALGRRVPLVVEVGRPAHAKQVIA